MRKTVAEQFSGKYMPITESGCWIWVGFTSPKGYGILKIGKQLKRAHRVSYELFRGQIPDNLFVCHRCDISSCVNPDHLFLGTVNDNNQDMKRKGRYRVPRGERHGAARFSDIQADSIRNDKRPHKYIREDFGISRQQIYRIKTLRSHANKGA